MTSDRGRAPLRIDGDDKLWDSVFVQARFTQSDAIDAGGDQKITFEETAGPHRAVSAVATGDPYWMMAQVRSGRWKRKQGTASGHGQAIL